MSDRVVELMPHTELWEEFFSKECMALKKVLRSNLFEVHHIGSTAIPAIKAKPTLDVLVSVHTFDGLDLFKNEFKAVGLEWRGEYGIEGRRYFVRKTSAGTHLSHIHMFEKHDSKIDDHLDFRDYLNSEAEVAKEYEKLKETLAEQFPEDLEKYTQGKSDFIKIVLDGLERDQAPEDTELH